MFLDASIIVAILAEENDWKEQLAKLQSSAVSHAYTSIVRYEATTAISRLRQQAKEGRTTAESLVEAEAIFDEFMKSISATEIAISPEIGRGALIATRLYGKAVGHKAALNFGDCFSYAAAKVLGVGLLYKGNDFALTDLA